MRRKYEKAEGKVLIKRFTITRYC